MSKSRQATPVNLAQMAHRAMVDYGFEPDFSKACSQQVDSLVGGRPKGTASGDGLKDLRDLLWSSIDNIESRDLDQIEYCEAVGADAIRLFVGIADVDTFVAQNTPLDEHASTNCFSIYTGVRTFPMLPTDLSEGLSSLLQDNDRRVMVTEVLIGSDGEMRSFDVYPALVRNKAKLAYEPVADWLDGKQKLPDLDRVAGLEEQLRLQDKLADWLETLHQKRGEVNVQTIEASPVMQDGNIMDLHVQEQNRAREIIKNFMVAANIGLAEFIRSKGKPMIQRVVKKPKRWGRIVDLAAERGFTLPAEPDSASLAKFAADQKAKDPLHFPDLSLAIVKLLGPGEYIVQRPDQPSEGHFGLAVHDYTHSTAPNRRYPDLVTQRLVKSLLFGGKTPYSADDLQAICDRCIDRENAARKLERFMRKVAAAVLLANRIGDVFDGIVTGASDKGTYVRLLSPPAEGRVMRNEEGLDVGDRCRVKLIATDPHQGFIDFARV